MDGLKTGDCIRVRCKAPTLNPDLQVDRVFEGEIISLFNAIQKDGSDYWLVEVKGPTTWFLWKPTLDGGSYERIPPLYKRKP